jgi:hypothetical protein
MKVNCALEVFMNCLSEYWRFTSEQKTADFGWSDMTIPFLILREVRIAIRQGVALSIIFLIVVITMIFAIVRAVFMTRGVSKQIDPIWMYMWSSVKLNIGMHLIAH